MADRATIAVMMLASICCLTAWQPTSATPTHAHKHSLGGTTEEHPQKTMHVVVAMYKENIEEVQHYISKVISIQSVGSCRPRVFLYVKGGREVALQAQKAGFAHDVIELPNIGREQETYLQHVVAHYEHLPAHVLFTQALSNFEEVTLDRLNTMFSPATGLLGLGLNAVCSCEGHSQLWEDPQTGGFIRLREVWAIAQGTLCPRKFACFHNGMIVASRLRLLLQPKEKWEYLRTLFFTAEDHPLREHEDMYHLAESVIFEEWATWGHVMERSWNALLNCTDPQVSYQCVEPGEPACAEADCTGKQVCQCLDHVVPDKIAPI